MNELWEMMTANLHGATSSPIGKIGLGLVIVIVLVFALILVATLAAVFVLAVGLLGIAALVIIFSPNQYRDLGGGRLGIRRAALLPDRPGTGAVARVGQRDAIGPEERREPRNGGG